MGEQVRAISHLHGNLRNLLRLAALYAAWFEHIAEYS